MRQLKSMLLVALVGATMAPAAVDAVEVSPGPSLLGAGTELLYENCYEHVAAFRVPISFIEGMAGSELPPGFAYRSFDPAGTVGQLNVVGLDCDQGGHRVTDLLINAIVNVPPAIARGLPTVLRVRTYTNSPQTQARYGLLCFGHLTALGEVEALVEIDPVTGERRGHVFASDGGSSIDFTTTVRPPSEPILAATLQHFTVKNSELRGLIEWGSVHGGLRQRSVPAAATLRVDGAPAPTVAVAASQHVFPAEGAPHTFFHRGLTGCPPGLDWIE
jgi:hypothetical protein